MKKGDTYQNFGCTWVVDDVYEVPDSELMNPDNPFGLWHKKRFKAHVIKAPEGYQGIREMDAALTGFMAEEEEK